MMKILILASSLNVGDIANYQATLEALKLQGVDVHNVEVVDAKTQGPELQASFDKAYDSENTLIIATGENGLKALEAVQAKISARKSSTYVYASVHQYFDTLPKIHVINNLAIPRAMLDVEKVAEALKHIPIKTPTISVPVEMKKDEELKAVYEDWAEKGDYPLSGKYIIATIPGDAPDYENKFHLFNKESATTFAETIRDLHARHPEHKIILIGSVRTGKMDPSDPRKVAFDHIFAAGAEQTNDPITAHIAALLTKSNTPYTLYPANFTRNSDKSLTLASPFWQFVALANLTENRSFYIVPGESVSQMAQAALMIDAPQTMAFIPSSANPQHLAVLGTLMSENYFQGGIVGPGKITSTKPDVYTDIKDANTVAKSIASGLQAANIIATTTPQLNRYSKIKVSSSVIATLLAGVAVSEGHDAKPPTAGAGHNR
jgi:hypothetical protein